MPRPCKRRQICAMPRCQRFGALEDSSAEGAAVTMTIDEFETIRLIDLEGMTQEDCSKQMKVARTTVQAIYNSARAKLAEFLVNGRELTISGGHYSLCQESSEGCGCGKRCRRGCCRGGQG